MIPFDSFLLDPPMLFGNGLILGRLLGDGKGSADRRSIVQALEVLTIAVFWGTSISLYLNKKWTRWIWEMCGAESGRDWMLNSGVFSFDHRTTRSSTHGVAAPRRQGGGQMAEQGRVRRLTSLGAVTRAAGSPAPSCGCP